MANVHGDLLIGNIFLPGEYEQALSAALLIDFATITDVTTVTELPQSSLPFLALRPWFSPPTTSNWCVEYKSDADPLGVLTWNDVYGLGASVTQEYVTTALLVSSQIKAVAREYETLGELVSRCARFIWRHNAAANALAKIRLRAAATRLRAFKAKTAAGHGKIPGVERHSSLALEDDAA